MDFQEDFLQTIWKYQYFDKKGLETTEGNDLVIRKIGKHNHFEGPDFLEAQVQIGKISYAGHIEIHKKASDWHLHNHATDVRYDPVILHVVWEDDGPVTRKDGTPLPTLVLKGRIWLDVLRNYERLVQTPNDIVCTPQVLSVPEIIRFSMLEMSLIERLEKKCEALLHILHQTKNDWEESTYCWLFQSFGFKTNSEPMRKLAESVPYKLLQRHAGQVEVIESILLGQAGLIPQNPIDEYSAFLLREYEYYKKKYKLTCQVHAHEWKFKGVRPANFPTLRIAQLAQLLNKSPNLFTGFLYEASGLEEIKSLLNIQLPEYWQSHYSPGNFTSGKVPGNLSPASLQLLLINAVAPLWYTFGKSMEDPVWKEKTLDLLQSLSAEDNFITRKFSQLGWKSLNAYDSQGQIALYRGYCEGKSCLNCKIGQYILKTTT
jgi:hypothetical protein